MSKAKVWFRKIWSEKARWCRGHVQS